MIRLYPAFWFANSRRKGQVQHGDVRICRPLPDYRWGFAANENGTDISLSTPINLDAVAPDIRALAPTEKLRRLECDQLKSLRLRKSRVIGSGNPCRLCGRKIARQELTKLIEHARA
jgi:hypothetical protein